MKKLISIPLFAAPTAGVSSDKKYFPVLNAEDSEILIHGPIGRSLWSNDGITGKDFTDALNEIPVGTKVTIGVNSQGGAVGEGLAIFNAIQRRSADITVRIDGYALSIASFFPLAASKVISPATALWMIHNVWSWMDGASGNAEDMRKLAELAEKAADMLDKHDDVLVAAYVERTGKSDKEIRQAMQDETWLTGSEAVEWGLADEESENAAALDALDFSGMEAKAFKKIPANCRSLILAAAGGIQPGTPRTTPVASSNSALKGGANNNTKIVMNRQQMLALLKTWGVETNDAMTDEQIVTLVGKGKPEASKPAPATPAATEPNVVELQKAVDQLKAQNAKERESRIKASLQKLVEERRVPAAQIETLLPKCVADESMLTVLADWPQQPEIAEPVAADPQIEAGNGSLNDVEKGVKNFRAPIESMLRGNSLDGKAVARNAIAVAQMINKHFAKLLPALNANTISADLKRIVILDRAMRAFKRNVLPLRAFATSFSNIPLKSLGGLNKVSVPYYALDTTASKDYVEADGYVFDQSSATGSKDVTINKRKYKPFNFYSQELARQPYFDTVRLMELKAEQLGIDVTEDVFSIVTAANFGAPVKAEAADAFNTDDIIDIRTAANQSDWPKAGRAILIDSAYEGNILKSLQKVNEAGSDQPLREGVIGRLAGFDIYENPRIPDNDEFLVGFAAFMSAILFGSAPIEPAPGVRKQLNNYDVVIDPDSGITLEYRYWGNPDKDEDREVVESNYGYEAGEAAALKRIVSQA